MLLVQKQTSITLSNKERVRKIVCLNLSTILIVKSNSLTLYDIDKNKQIMVSCIAQWQEGGVEIADENTSVLEAAFHPKLYKIYLLLSKNIKDKHQNWLFVEIQLEGNKFKDSKVLMDYENYLTKYKEMELKPRIILMPSSDYVILLREFYNDSMVVVFQNGHHLFDFFINQENMSEFDATNELVSYRSLFINRISFYLFNISQSLKNSQSREHSVNVQKSGVILGIKKIGQNMIKGDSIFESQFAEKQKLVEVEDSFEVVIAVNWRNKSFSYLIYNSLSRQVIKDVIDSNSRLDSIIFSFFGVNNLKTCALQLKGNRQVLVYQNFITRKQTKSVEIQQYEVDERYQEWDAFNIDNQTFVILQYSQPTVKQDQIHCKFYRNLNRQQAMISIISEIGISQNLLQAIVQMTRTR